MVFLLNLFRLENLKAIAIVFLIGLAIWFYKDYQFQKTENVRQTENNKQLRKYDSLKFASQTYTTDELQEFLDFQRKDLKQYLDKNKVSVKRIERIITQKLNYLDTVNRSQNLQPILDAIKNNQNLKVPVIDSTDCLIIRGWVVFENDSLSLNITDRQFTNVTDVVSYWERNQWKLLGIKTRLFGRKKATVIIKDKCGKTRTFLIDKKQ